MAFRRFAARVLPVATILGIFTMLKSLASWGQPAFTGFLDRLVIGANHHRLGFDFFSVPRGFLNLLHGASIYNLVATPYGLYASPYFYHPALAILVGSWTSPFAPFVGYWLFVLCSLALLGLSAWRIAQHTPDPLIKTFAFFAVFCTLPTYLLLWNAQMHVFTIIAVALLMSGVLQLAHAEPSRQRVGHWQIAIGLLASLFSKPLVFLFIPALLCARETRATTLRVLGVYVVASALFFLPALNPEGTNATHWLNLVAKSAHIEVGNPQIFSLTTFVMAIAPSVPAWLFKAPLLLLGVASAGLLALRARAERLSMLLLTIIMGVYLYYVSYTEVWEYHFTTLLPTLPVLAILIGRDPHGTGQRLLRAMLWCAVPFFLPTLFVFVYDTATAHVTMGRALRVLPATAMWVLSTVYLAHWWRHRRDIIGVAELVAPTTVTKQRGTRAARPVRA